MALRPVDLARSAGVSTQLVRNYEHAGVLPPAGRSPAGYRQYDDGHRRALHTYRALAPGYGTEAARDIMRAVHAGDVAAALAVVDASHAALHAQRLAVAELGETLSAVATQSPETFPVPRSGLPIGEVAGYLGVRTSALRVWESAGLLRPERDPGTAYRRYGPDDVRDARLVAMLRQGHYPLDRIGPILDGVRRTGGTAALREAVTERQAALTKRAMAMLDGTCALRAYLAGSS